MSADRTRCDDCGFEVTAGDAECSLCGGDLPDGTPGVAGH